MNDSDDILNKMKKVFESVLPSPSTDEYPKEAMPLGTWVRSERLGRLGVITDAFYGDVDNAGQKIIVYTLLLFPRSNNYGTSSRSKENFYLTNEYEYEVIGYLMMNPINLDKLSPYLGGIF